MRPSASFSEGNPDAGRLANGSWIRLLGDIGRLKKTAGDASLSGRPDAAGYGIPDEETAASGAWRGQFGPLPPQGLPSGFLGSRPCHDVRADRTHGVRMNLSSFLAGLAWRLGGESQ